MTVADAGGAGILSGAAEDTVRSDAPPPHSGLPGAVWEGDRSPLEACAAVRAGEAPCHLEHPGGAGDWLNPEVRGEYRNVTGLDETAGYIRHHLEQAGRTAKLFTDDAITQIHQAARGKPRTVNNICTPP